jgi:hypothetical protein
MSFAYVLEGASPLAPDEIVDPGSICEVEFSISARRRADVEFFNRIDPLPTFTTDDTSRSQLGVEGPHRRRIPMPQGRGEHLLYVWLQSADNKPPRREVIDGR